MPGPLVRLLTQTSASPALILIRLLTGAQDIPPGGEDYVVMVAQVDHRPKIEARVRCRALCI